LGILIFVFLISFSLILLSVKIFISGEIEAQKILFSQREKEFKNSQLEQAENQITLSNDKLSKLDIFYKNQWKATEILEKISNTLPKGSHLTNFSITFQAETTNVNLIGFSQTREILLSFKENLEREELFKEIYFPPANWTEPTNINFTVNFKIK